MKSDDLTYDEIFIDKHLEKGEERRNYITRM